MSYMVYIAIVYVNICEHTCFAHVFKDPSGKLHDPSENCMNFIAGVLTESMIPAKIA